MARKPNYGFEKRKKELDRKAKKEEKLRRRRENASDRAEDSTSSPEPVDERPPEAE